MPEFSGSDVQQMEAFGSLVARGTSVACCCRDSIRCSVLRFERGAGFGGHVDFGLHLAAQVVEMSFSIRIHTKDKSKV